MTTLTIPQLEKWYRKRLRAKSKDFIKKAERSYRIVDHALKDVQSVARALRDSSSNEDSEIEGIASRFALKIDEIVNAFDMKADITYSGTESMQSEIQHFIQELWGAGARWIKRMDKRHKGTIKQLDAYMKDLINAMKMIGKLLYEYSWLKDLERISSRIETLRDLTYGKEMFEESIRQTRLKIDQAKKEYDFAKKELDEFRSTSNVSDILNLDEEASHLAGILRMKLNTLKKPVKKFLQHDTGVRMTPAGSKALTDYFEDPYTAIVEEPDGYPGLIEGLEGLKEAIEKGKIPIKDRLGRRAIEEVEQIKKGSLLEIQKKAKSIEAKRHEFAGSDIYRKAEELELKFEEARKNLEYHQNDLYRIRDEIQRQLEKIQEFRKRIESEIAEAFDEKITIDIGETLEPLLAKCEIKL
ncbi:MAG: hypothetical protein ACTSYL_02110 [Candidatus Thorarchaeota archaeon]